MQRLVTIVTLLAVLVFPACSLAHTTVIFPVSVRDGRQELKVVHFSPGSGDNIMGIRLHEKDTRVLKGLESIFMIHDGSRTDISGLALPDFYSVRNGTGESYTIPISRKLVSKAGDYVFVVRHVPHWKPRMGLYIQKIAKFYINRGGLITDWPHRVLKDAPEIVPLSAPYALYRGMIFRAEVVNEKGKLIPNARIHVEFLNYNPGEKGLDVSAPITQAQDMAERILFADRSGSFSFVPPLAGIWTFTLMDGDSGLEIEGKKLQFDSSVSIKVLP